VPPSDDSHLKRIRLYEIERLQPYFERGKTVLEIGAGAGWQARVLADWGLRVVAVDVPATTCDFRGVWNAVLYDGAHLPLADHSVDLVLSSNVLEHIAHVVAFQKELQRVLRPSGIAVHLMPSASWRFWTAAAHYGEVIRRLRRKMISNALSAHPTSAVRPPSTRERLSRLLIPERHGEVGNFVTELYTFSRRRWCKLFIDSGWQIETVFAGGLFYTGYSVLGDRLSLSTREKLARILGSACSVYIVKSPP